ncbi:hypothetical protein KUTeg_002229 [Tegillarca granosa]|uniref:Uncharacterized protein n=1 Tax=Tegillarca granosa TaxID=220873 RepID=A0ABQ9FV45_TEGGR|nr:hypothetical protein KUTeg_002229 [Tegillarca granosa]
MVQRMTALQHACGAGDIMAQQKQCMRDLDRNMAECYAKVGLNETLFRNPDGSSQVRGAIIGANEQSTRHYCRIRVEHLGCDIEAWKTKCTDASVGLKNEYEFIHFTSSKLEI